MKAYSEEQIEARFITLRSQYLKGVIGEASALTARRLLNMCYMLKLLERPAIAKYYGSAFKRPKAQDKPGQ